MEKHHGLLIVNEGPDGSGKEVQTGLLCTRLQAAGFTVRRFDFPTYGKDPVADGIRFLLRYAKDEWNALPWKSKALLFAANHQRFASEIAGACETKGVVVCNRFVPSNQAHMAGYAVDDAEWKRRFTWIAKLEYEMLSIPRPDIVLLHTVSEEVRAELLKAREQGGLDAHEENAEYLSRVSHAYHLLSQLNPDAWRHVPADVDGRLQSPQKVHERVWTALTTHPAW